VGGACVCVGEACVWVCLCVCVGLGVLSVPVFLLRTIGVLGNTALLSSSQSCRLIDSSCRPIGLTEQRKGWKRNAMRKLTRKLISRSPLSTAKAAPPFITFSSIQPLFSTGQPAIATSCDASSSFLHFHFPTTPSCDCNLSFIIFPRAQFRTPAPRRIILVLRSPFTILYSARSIAPPATGAAPPATKNSTRAANSSHTWSWHTRRWRCR